MHLLPRPFPQNHQSHLSAAYALGFCHGINHVRVFALKVTPDLNWFGHSLVLTESRLSRDGDSHGQAEVVGDCFNLAVSGIVLPVLDTQHRVVGDTPAPRQRHKLAASGLKFRYHNVEKV